MAEQQNPNQLRDEAIALGKSAKTEENFARADHAFGVAALNDSTRDFRELGVTNIFAAALQARWSLAFSDHTPDQESLNLAKEGFRCLERADQYSINTIGRVSVLETLHGSKFSGLRLGVAAVAGSVFSEAKWRPYSNSDLSLSEKFKAKGRALTRGLGAVGVSALSLMPGSSASNIRDKLADKVLK